MLERIRTMIDMVTGPRELVGCNLVDLIGGGLTIAVIDRAGPATSILAIDREACA